MDDPRQQRRPDISRAQALLKWTPTITLQDGLRHPISYFAERIKDLRAGLN